LLAATLAIWATVHGTGPFMKATVTESLYALQTFMGCSALAPLMAAGAMADRSRAIRMREDFLATISHDLRSPLQVVQMSTEKLARTMPDERVVKHADVVRRASSRMTHLISDLLDVAVLEGHRLTLAPSPIDARALVTDVLQLFRPVAEAKNHKLVSYV